MLRITAAILSMMILTMVTIPCADSLLCDSTSGTEQFTGLDQHQETSHIDFCTPFCSCHCCHTHITQIAFFSLQDIDLYQYDSPAHSRQLYGIMSFSIWDPPRLS